MHYNASYPWYETALLGFFYALIGLNIQHDANHGSLSVNPWVNRFWGKIFLNLACLKPLKKILNILSMHYTHDTVVIIVLVMIAILLTL